MKGRLDIAVSEAIYQEPLAVQLALLEQARLLFGVDKARLLWKRLRLPDLDEERPIRSHRHHEVDTFISACLAPAPGAQLKASVLYSAFLKSRTIDVPPISMTAFGRALLAAGIPRFVGRVTFYLDVQFSPDPSEARDLPLFTPQQAISAGYCGDFAP